MNKEKELIVYSVLGLAGLICVLGFFYNELAAGLLLLLVLSSAVAFTMARLGVQDKTIYKVFLLSLVVHLAAVLFIYYSGFKPFGGGGDFSLYNQIATEIAHRFGQGNFSLDGLYTDHFFPILIGILYMITLPSMIVGQFFTIWLAAVSILLVYLITLEIGGTKKTALLVSLIAIMYPSYLYFGSILLKDTLVIPLVLLGIFLILKMVKHFSWIKFLLFFIILTCLINLRFYVGYALMASFVFSWPLLTTMNVKAKMIHWLLIIFLLGFSSQITGSGYYGYGNIKKFINPKSISYYREVVYANPAPVPAPTPVSEQPKTIALEPEPPSQTPSEPITPQPTVLTPSAPEPSAPAPVAQNPPPSPPEIPGNGSTFTLETGFNKGLFVFLKNYSQSFIFSLLGPFPWQFKHSRQIMGLVETIPWYILIMIFSYSIVKLIKEKGVSGFLKFYKFSLPLALFGILTLAVLSLFINNYGIIVRIRIPVFMCLATIMVVGLNSSLDNFSNKSNEKISHYWGRWIHRV